MLKLTKDSIHKDTLSHTKKLIEMDQKSKTREIGIILEKQANVLFCFDFCVFVLQTKTNKKTMFKATVERNGSN